MSLEAVRFPSICRVVDCLGIPFYMHCVCTSGPVRLSPKRTVRRSRTPKSSGVGTVMICRGFTKISACSVWWPPCVVVPYGTEFRTDVVQGPRHSTRATDDAIWNLQGPFGTDCQPGVGAGRQRVGRTAPSSVNIIHPQCLSSLPCGSPIPSGAPAVPCILPSTERTGSGRNRLQSRRRRAT